MNYYIEMTFLPSADININFLWNRIFQPLHLKFVEMQNQEGLIPIGIAFPEYRTIDKPFLGTKLRLIAEDRKILDDLNLRNDFKRFQDHLHITGVREVPLQRAVFVQYLRKQTKSNVERLARRRAKRTGISYEEALKKYKNFKEKTARLPFIKTKSLSTGKQFPLLIEKKESEKTDSFLFNTYGLSQDSAVPEF